MTTDFRALCAELLAELENAIRVIYREDGTRHISGADPVITKTDAALAQPDPEGELTDEKLRKLWCSGWDTSEEWGAFKFARAVEAAVIARRDAQPLLATDKMLAADDIPAGPFSENELRQQWNIQADETEQWDTLDTSEQLAWAQARAIAADRARRPAPPADGRAPLAQPEPEVAGLSDEELLELMPETMRDEFSYAAKTCSDVTGGQVKPGIFRVCLNTAALEYARAVLARWGRPAPAPAGEVAEVAAWLRAYRDEEFGPRSVDPDVLWLARAADLLEQRQTGAEESSVAVPVPVAVSERLPGPEDCDSHGWCWVLYSGHSTWTLEPPYGQDGMPTGWTHWLPANALPLPSNTESGDSNE